MKNEILEKRISYFTERCYYYANVLNNLYEYQIFEIEGENDFRARFSADVSGRIISIYCSNEWLFNDNVTFVEIDKVAFHEVYESTFAEMMNYLMDFYSKTLIDSLIHNNVRLVENVFFDYVRDMSEI